MAQIVFHVKDISYVGFDLFPPDYMVVPEWPWPHVASSPKSVMHNMRRFGEGKANFVFHTGDSQFTVPQFFKEHPDFMADLVLVDGDHSEEGARRDLEAVLPHTRAVVFDDIIHPFHPYLEKVWDETLAKCGKTFWQEKDHFDIGAAIAVIDQ